MAATGTATVSRRGRRGPIVRLGIVGAVSLLLSVACASGPDDVRAVAGAGWSSYGGNAANSAFADVTPQKDLALSWTRPTGGPISAPVSISGRSNVGVTSRTANGCNTFVLDPRAGRKNFCRRSADGAELNTMLVDQYDNVYLGQPGGFTSYTGGGAVRWTVPTVGLPLSAKFAGPGVVLVVTNQGQVEILSSQTGDPVLPGVSLRPDTNASDPTANLGDCVTGRPNCPVQASPAVDDASQRFYLNFWPQNSIASQVRGFTYGRHGGAQAIRDAWTAQIPSGVIGTPTLSADRRTLYVFDRLGNIYALDSATGVTRWKYDVGGYGFGTMTVAPNGVLIPTGVIGSPLRAIRDAGGRAEPLWQRGDLQVVSLSALTASGSAWTVVRDSRTQDLRLVEVSADDGTMRRSYALPKAVGFATGVAVSAAGAIATATNIGEVYFFDAPDG